MQASPGYSYGGSPDTANGDDGKRRRVQNTGRTSQACTRCRSLKMKCIGATDPPCRRCRRTGATCDFVPRANAARPWSPGPYPAHTCTELWRSEVNTRLKTLETANARLEALVAQLQRQPNVDDTPVDSSHSSQLRGAGALDLDLGSRSSDLYTGTVNGGDSGVLVALERLRQELPPRLVAGDAWSPTIVLKLWESFRSHMPGLHFFSGKVSFVQPTPLLAVAILHVAAAHYPSSEVAKHQPAYFQAFSRAVGSLSVPDCPIRGSCAAGPNGELVSAKFDDVLGIILVGLLAVGWVDTVGMWVNTAYRLLLDGMAEERGRRQAEWRGLWEGLRTIELEHSSLHLICPALPRDPPNPPFSDPAPAEPTSAGGSIGELLGIMQRCMPRFVGRGLPTVWDTVCSTTAPAPAVIIGANQDDITAIQAWAAEVDAWYQRSAAETVDSTMYVRSIILLNYHLHKLFVLSIFLPLRGVNYTSLSERAELLESSRVVLKIESSGFEVWSSWDLVIITNASLILLQAWALGTADAEDLDMVQNHLNILTCTHQTAPSLRHTLSNRLEMALQQVRTPVRQAQPLPSTSSPANADPQKVVGWLQPNDHNQSNGEYRGGHLFTDQAPDLNILPSLPPFEVSDACNLAEWPPFLINMFGYGEGQGQGVGQNGQAQGGPNLGQQGFAL